MTGLLVPGENVLSAVLGNGFYNEDAPVATWDFENARWRDRARMIGELHIVYADGSATGRRIGRHVENGYRAVRAEQHLQRRYV